MQPQLNSERGKTYVVEQPTIVAELIHNLQAVGVSEIVAERDQHILRAVQLGLRIGQTEDKNNNKNEKFLDAKDTPTGASSYLEPGLVQK